MKRISIVTPCFNEEENVEKLGSEVKKIMEGMSQYDYEHLFIDNASRDRTPELLRKMAEQDSRVKVILNTRNFGHIRSPYHGLLQASGDAAILLVCDFQDPLELIQPFIEKWESGYKVVLGVKDRAEETPIMFAIRKAYYSFVARIADIDLTKNNTGFGLYDRQVLDLLKEMKEPYPYFRGLVADLGFEAAKITYKQPRRTRGVTSQNFYTLYDIAMLGITNHSKIPLRLATMAGFLMSLVSFAVAFIYLVAKLLFWDQFTLGMAPILIGVFLFSSVQLFFVGILGEYIGAIYTQVLKRPLVVEKERINF